VITADDVDVLLFDVLGTVVDESGSMHDELAAALDHAGVDREQADALATAWIGRFAVLMTPIVDGGPWRTTDELNAEALVYALRDIGPRLPESTVRELALVGHRLRPWPDSAQALRELARRFTIVALSNGNLSMLTELFAGAGLTWHGVLSAELVGAYKPDPAVYRFALDQLALDPHRTLMVAAHPWDLRAAAAHGLRTAYIERAGEGEPLPSDRFDLTVRDLAALSAALTAPPELPRRRVAQPVPGCRVR
jgi:2-haloacid dehalogenase